LGNSRGGGMIRWNAKSPLAQFIDRLVARLAGANQPDDFINVHHRINQALENVPALLRLFQLEARAPDNHLFAMIDEVFDHLLEAHRAWLTIHQGNVDHADGDFARRVLEKLPHDQIGIGIALQIDDDAHLVLSPGMVVGVSDVLKQVLFHAIADGLDDRLAHDAVGQLGDDDLTFAVFLLLDMHFGAHGYSPAAGGIAFDDAVAPANDAGGW